MSPTKSDQFDSRAAASGRPKLDPARKRCRRLRLAVTDAELAQIGAQAAALGLRPGVYLRSAALLGGPDGVGAVDVLARLLAQLRGVAGNLNQYSHRANVALAQDPPDLALARAEQSAMASLESDLSALAGEIRAALSALSGVRS